VEEGKFFSLSLFAAHHIPFRQPAARREHHAPPGEASAPPPGQGNLHRLPKNTHGPRVRGPAEESICTTLFALSSPMDLEDDERYAAAALYTLALHLVQV
jgi:hypothetical protein